MALPGIGETLAGRIVAYREENGPFLRADQVMAISGHRARDLREAALPCPGARLTARLSR